MAKPFYKPKEEKIRSKAEKGRGGYVRDIGVITASVETRKNRREFGAHLTSVDVFQKFVLPEIKDILHEHVWVDLFAGEGNLILPMLNLIPQENRVDFFRNHIFLSDIQKEMVEKSIANAKKYGIPYNIAKANIRIRDTLKNYPKFIRNLKYPPFHITNPPYLYLGYIAKHSERNLQYFSGPNEGYQDLYQIALINDLRNGLERMVYIIPTNFLFGSSVSNKIRRDFFRFYSIKRAIVFEKRIFEFTGTNVCICFFERKKAPSSTPISFRALKINDKTYTKTYQLRPINSYRAGGEFDEFVSHFKPGKSLKVEFYLTLEEIKKNKGGMSVRLLDVNDFSNGCFRFGTYNINQALYRKLKQNPLFVRTLDTGGWEGRVGIYNAKETFNVDGIVVTKKKYRTHPIQVFLEPALTSDTLRLLKDYFNLMLEYFRDVTDSDFLTTFKYSNSNYIRKYLGLTQTRKLIETFPIHSMSDKQKRNLKILIEQKNIQGIKNILLGIKNKERGQTRLLSM